MADDKTKDGAAVVGGESELVDVEIDGQTVKAPKAAAEILKKKEHDLASRNEQILRDERAKMVAEKTEFQEKFKKDTQAYNELLAKGVKDLSKYDPLTLDGSGKYLGEIPNESNDDDVNPMQHRTPVSPAFANNELTTLRGEIKGLKDTLVSREKAEAQEAIAFMDETQQKRFPLADPDAVLLDMKTYHDTYGRPPSESKIVEFLKRRHDRIATKLPADKKAKVESAETLPDTRGAKSPERTPTEKLPPLSDLEGWAAKGREFLRTVKT